MRGECPAMRFSPARLPGHGRGQFPEHNRSSGREFNPVCSARARQDNDGEADGCQQKPVHTFRAVAK
jgi:hypothetical protein